jgi:hypothetical protein
MVPVAAASFFLFFIFKSSISKFFEQSRILVKHLSLVRIDQVDRCLDTLIDSCDVGHEGIKYVALGEFYLSVAELVNAFLVFIIDVTAQCAQE